MSSRANGVPVQLVDGIAREVLSALIHVFDLVSGALRHVLSDAFDVVRRVTGSLLSLLLSVGHGLRKRKSGGQWSAHLTSAAAARTLLQCDGQLLTVCTCVQG